MNFPPEYLISECTIQSEFYHQCRLANVPCVLELHTTRGRLDAVIFTTDWQGVLAIVECKNNAAKKVRHGNQIRRYKTLGVPVYGLADITVAPRLIASIIRANHTPKPFSDFMSLPPLKLRRGVERPFTPLDLAEEINYKD